MGNLMWKGKSLLSKTPWGSQVVWTAPWGPQGKITHLEAGHRTSKKKYKRKNEILYLLDGSVIVKAFGNAEFYDFVDEDGSKCFNMEPGDTVLIEPGSVYRIVAKESSTLIEVAVNGQDETGITRIEDDYGRT